VGSTLKSVTTLRVTPEVDCDASICYNCIAFKLLDGPQDAEGELGGECRLKPPVVATIDEDGYPMTVWPLVIAQGWCLCFGKRPTT